MGVPRRMLPAGMAGLPLLPGLPTGRQKLGAQGSSGTVKWRVGGELNGGGRKQRTKQHWSPSGLGSCAWRPVGGLVPLWVQGVRPRTVITTWMWPSDVTLRAQPWTWLAAPGGLGIRNCSGWRGERC